MLYRNFGFKKNFPDTPRESSRKQVRPQNFAPQLRSIGGQKVPLSQHWGGGWRPWGDMPLQEKILRGQKKREISSA